MNNSHSDSTNSSLSFNTRKSLCVHINELAGKELANMLEEMANRIRHLEATKVDVTPIAPGNSRGIDLG